MKTVVYGSSIKGNGHFISGTQCQDNNSFDEKDFSDDEIKVIALSDGHGGAPYCRSAKGSRLAVDITKKELYDFVNRIKPFLDEIDSAQRIIDEFSKHSYDAFEENTENTENTENSEVTQATFDVSPLKMQIEALQKSISIELEAVKSDIVKAWTDAVDNDFMSEPIQIIGAKIFNFSSISQEQSVKVYRGYGNVSEDSIDFVNVDLPTNIIDSIEKNPRQLYGATLLALAQYKEHVFILQVGDGDVIVIDSEDNVDYPIKKGSHMIGNETDSLCQRDVINRFNSLYLRNKVKIAMLSTDGVANALENEQELKTVAQGVYESITDEPDNFRSSFKPFLRFFSNASMDDCTLCFIANGVNEEAYEIIKNSVETEEEHTLDDSYQPLFENYTLNRDLFELIYTEKNGQQTITSVDFTNVGITAIQNSFMLEQYIDLVESKQELELLDSQRKLIFDIVSYGKRYLNEREQLLNATQKEVYCKMMNSILSQNSFKLINYKVAVFEMDENSNIKSIKKTIKDERYAVVSGTSGHVIQIEDVTLSLFDTVKSEFGTLVTFSEKIPITDTFSLEFEKYDIKLIKEK